MTSIHLVLLLVGWTALAIALGLLFGACCAPEEKTPEESYMALAEQAGLSRTEAKLRWFENEYDRKQVLGIRRAVTGK